MDDILVYDSIPSCKSVRHYRHACFYKQSRTVDCPWHGQLPRQMCPRIGQNRSTYESPHEEGCEIRLGQAAGQSLPANEGLYHEWQNTSVLLPLEGNHSSGGGLSTRGRKAKRLPMHQSH